MTFDLFMTGMSEDLTLIGLRRKSDLTPALNPSLVISGHFAEITG
jgi:hypothetical protein